MNELVFKNMADKVLQMTKKALFRLMNAFISIVIVCLRPIVQVKIVHITSERIGHLAFNTDSFLRKLQLQKGKKGRKTVYIGITQSPPANRQLLKMFYRQMMIIQLPLKIYKYILKSIMNNKSIFANSRAGTYSEFELFHNTEVNLKFTPQENKKGIKLLQDMGISQDDWYVCFQARDPLYLEKTGRDLYGIQMDWSYHNYRDCSIRNYILAAEYIVSKGGFAIRMGKDVGEPLPKGLSPRIIDYATYHWSDFGDIYLSANCKYFIGSSAGLAVVPYIFHKPMIMANYTPLSVAFSPRMDNLAIPKKIWSAQKDRYLTFKEILTSEVNNFAETRHFEQAGLELVENTENEILDVTKEMYARVFKEFEYTDNDHHLQMQLKACYPPAHQCFNTPIHKMIGIQFLRDNPFLLEEAMVEKIEIK
jgi:putative glycosyltransferase (TIGR04372 family)